MRFCVPFPMFPADHVVALAPVAESAGFDLIAVPDSVFYPEEVSADYPYSHDGKRFWPADSTFVEPFIAIATMAALTSRIRFTTNVVKLPLREPLIVAKQLSSLAVISGERVEIGVGLSWIPEEFAWTGTDMRTRGARLDEQIAILRETCGGGGARFVEFHGKHYDFGRLMLSPSPMAAVPIHVGGHSEPALRRAARAADGWISVQTNIADVRKVVAELAALREGYGTIDRPFDVNVLPLDIAPNSSGLDAYSSLASEIEAAGMRPVFQVVPWYFSGGDPNSLAVREESLARFGDEVIAALA
jgi:probable F420-dependent oxidoreductase